jgi:hypothetical protein
MMMWAGAGASRFSTTPEMRSKLAANAASMPTSERTSQGLTRRDGAEVAMTERCYPDRARKATLVFHAAAVAFYSAVAAGAATSTVSNSAGSVISINSRSSECATSLCRMPGG